MKSRDTSNPRYRHVGLFSAGILTGLAIATAHLSAQQVRGSIADADTGDPAAWALVSLLDSHGDPVSEGVADEEGRFALDASEPGPYRLRVERLGYRPAHHGALPTDQEVATELRLSLRFEALELPAGVVLGRVVDVEGLRPVPGLRVEVPGAGIVETTDAAGAFAIANLAPGRHSVRFRHLSYTATEDTLFVEEGSATLVTVRVSRGPIAVEPLSVRIRPATRVPPALRDFYERRARGRGYFFTREEIEARAIDRTSELFRGIPGLQLIPTDQTVDPRTGELVNLPVMVYHLRSTRAGTDCPLTYFVDGLRYDPGLMDLEEIPLEQLTAVEVYRSPSEVPPRFAGLGGACGAVVFWTGRGLASREASAARTVAHLSPGDRLRVTVLEAEPSPLVGQLVALDLEGLRVRDVEDGKFDDAAGQHAERRLPYSAIARLEVSDGRRSRAARGALHGGLGGALAGVFAFSALGAERESLLVSVSLGVVTGGALGAAVGAFLGSRDVTEQWHPVTLPTVGGR